MAILFLVLWGTSILFSIVASPIYILTKSVGGLKVWGFLNSSLLSCDVNLLCMQYSPGPLQVVPVGLGDKGIQEKHEAHAACCAVSKKVLSFFQPLWNYQQLASYIARVKLQSSWELWNYINIPCSSNLKCIYLFLSVRAYGSLFLQKVTIHYYCYFLWCTDQTPWFGQWEPFQVDFRISLIYSHYSLITCFLAQKRYFSSSVFFLPLPLIQPFL